MNQWKTSPESSLAHQLLDGLDGIEIGPGAHNPFGLRTRNIGLTATQDWRDYEYYAQMQAEACGAVARIDLAADAASLPLAAESVDFVIHSHVWEHLPNPLVALEEWARVAKSGGFIFAIVPKRDADPLDRARSLTPLAELELHHAKGSTYPDRIAEMGGPARSHYTVFSPELLHGIGAWFNREHFWTQLEEKAFQETDDKVGNGHTIVWQVRKFRRPWGGLRALRARGWRCALSLLSTMAYGCFPDIIWSRLALNSEPGSHVRHLSPLATW